MEEDEPKQPAPPYLGANPSDTGKPAAGTGEKQEPAGDNKKLANLDPDRKIELALATLVAFATLIYASIAGWQLCVLSDQTKATRIAADAARDAAQTAQRELNLTHRPWVRAEITAGQFWIDKSGSAQLSIRLRCSNAGHSPAAYVNPLVRLFALDFARFSVQPLQEQSDLCRSAATSDEFALSQPPRLTIFPTDSVEQWHSASLDRAEIGAVLESETGKQLGGFQPIVAVCVSYRFGYDLTRSDYSAYLFSVERITPADPNHPTLFKVPKGIDEADEIRLMPYFFGGSESIGSARPPVSAKWPTIAIPWPTPTP